MIKSMQSAPRCEFWLGRAGSGKTYGCLEAIATELKHSARGGPLILLAPEQTTAQLERMLATWPGLIGGFTRARVLSFNHLVREAFGRAGGAPASPMSETARIMLLRRIILHDRHRLKAFQVTAGQPGLAETIHATLMEFYQYGWRPEDLQQRLSLSGESGEETETLFGRKLHDLVLLWRGLEAALAKGGWSGPGEAGRAAVEAVRRWDDVHGMRLWVDGFASFTGHEIALLETLIQRARHTVLALCVDPEPILGGPLHRPAGPWGRIGLERVFENTEQTFLQLRNRFTDHGWEVAVKALPETARPGRFASGSVLEHLEARVLGRLHVDVFTDRCEDLELIEAGDRRAEVEAVARRLVHLCRRRTEGEPGRTVPWRRVAVLTRDLEPYADVVREVFDRFAIPYFLDRPRRMDAHPLARLIVAALRVLGSGWSGRALLDYVKTGLVMPEHPDRIAWLENEIRATDPDGHGWLAWLKKRASRELSGWWDEIAAPLKRLEADLISGLSPARAFWRLLEDVGADDTLERWMQREREAGREATAQLHEQAWQQTLGWFEDLDALVKRWPDLLDDPEAGREDFRHRLGVLGSLVESALNSVRARLIPPTLNQVTVGSVDRSRTPPVETVFVLGLNQGEFPRLWTPDPMLDDDDRNRLGSEEKRIGPDSMRRHLQEYFLVYIALTRSSRRLVVSRSLVDERGAATEPSKAFDLIRRAFPRAPIRRVDRAGQGEPPGLGVRPAEWALQLTSAYTHLCHTGLAEPLASLMRVSHPLDEGSLEPSVRQALVRAAEAMRPLRPARLSPETSKAYWADRGRLSVTALERYGACPFKFFASSVLRLEPREEAGLTAMDLGSLRHQLLEHLYERLKARDGLDWGQVDPEKAAKLIDAWFAAEAVACGDRLRALDRMLAEACAREMKLFVQGLCLAGRRSAFRQVAAERPFGAEDGAMRVRTPHLTFGLRGKIDRVDQYDSKTGPIQLVVDYKTGVHKLDLARMVNGIDLQLVVYGMVQAAALASGHDAKGRIGGLFYWPMQAPWTEAQPGEAIESGAIEQEGINACKPSGLFEEDVVGLLDGEARPGEKSPVFPFSLTKKGDISGTGRSHVSPGLIATLMKFQQTLLMDMVDRIAEGRIAVEPFEKGHEKACHRCEFEAVCRRLEPEVERPRPIVGLDLKGLLEKMEEWRGEGRS